VRPEQREWAVDLDPKRAIVADLAGRYGAAFVALHSILTLAAEVQGAAALAADGVHPTPLGARLIADAWQATARSLDA
jgi:lysophospholipase L1-like esterase